ncbi:MAG: RHS repeat-associated core domain-containing protein, partial [Streptosporangiaceae bacterium]
MSSYNSAYNPSTPTSGTALNQVLYQYDSNGNLDAEYQEHGGLVNTASSVYVGYGYDDSTAVVGGVTTSVTGYRPTTLQYPTTGTASSRVLTYSYGTAGGGNDEINRLDSIYDGSGTATSVTLGAELASYSYLGTDTIVTENYEQPQIELDYAGNTAGSYAGLDQFDRVVDQIWSGYGIGNSGTLDGYQYGYNLQADVAYRQNLTAGSADLDQAYTYDKADQLTSLTQGQVNTATDLILSGTQNFSQSWALDDNGNWTSLQQATTPGNVTLAQTRTPNAVNQISHISTTTGSAWIQPQYDGGDPGPGNMTTTPMPGSETVGLTCTYDAWNRLVNVSNGGAINVSYSYDGLGREITRTNNNAVSGTVATTDLYYAGQRLLETSDRLPASPENGATAVTQQYVWSAMSVNSPIETDRTVSTYNSGTWTPPTDRLYYLTDANDNVTAVTNASGVVQERYSYDAYGHVTVYNSGWTVTGTASAFGNTILFAGMDCDPATGLYYDSARWYNPSTGGFLTTDPILSSANLYEYAGNDPTGEADPSGLVAQGPPWTASGTPGTPATPGPNPTCASQQGAGDT